MGDIVSFSRFVPYTGIPHAGGELYRLHLIALERLGHRVTVVAPHSIDNDAARMLEGSPRRLLLIGSSTTRSLIARALEQAEHRLLPTRMTFAVRHAVRTSASVRQVVSSADLLEFQWLETATLIPSAIAGRSGQRQVAFLHDIPSQSFERQVRAAASAPIRGALARWRGFVSRRDEARVVETADVVLTLSEKDARLIDPAVSRSVFPVRPPLFVDEPPVPNSRSAGRPEILFVGAFDRNVNSDAAIWLIDEILPQVAAHVPEVVLVLAGANPTVTMLDRANRSDRVRVTGRVRDLSPYYRDASVVAVPLASGAGVKFKTIHALLYAKPVVTTPIGIEGIADTDSGLFFAVETEPLRFAEALTRALLESERAASIGYAAQQWAERTFGIERYMGRISATYDPGY